MEGQREEDRLKRRGSFEEIVSHFPLRETAQLNLNRRQNHKTICSAMMRMVLIKSIPVYNIVNTCILCFCTSWAYFHKGTIFSILLSLHCI